MVNIAAYLVAHRHPTHLMYPCLLFQMAKKIVGMEMLLMCKHVVKNFLEFCSNIMHHQIKILEEDAKMGLRISAVFILKKFIFREQVK